MIGGWNLKVIYLKRNKPLRSSESRGGFPKQDSFRAKLFLGYTREVLEYMKKITMKMKGNSIYPVEMNKGIRVYLTK